MSSAISRRSLAKGAAWAAPVVLASATIPAYAASTREHYYWLDGSWASDYYTKRSYGVCTTTFYIWNSDDATVAGTTYRRGFRVGYDDGVETDTTATMTSDLYFYKVMPRGYVSWWEVTSGNWEYLGIDNRVKLVYPNNRPVSIGYNQEVHIFRWTGERADLVRRDSEGYIWTDSETFEAIAVTEDLCVDGNYTAIGGYMGSFTLGNKAQELTNASTILQKSIGPKS